MTDNSIYLQAGQHQTATDGLLFLLTIMADRDGLTETEQSAMVRAIQTYGGVTLKITATEQDGLSLKIVDIQSAS